MKRTLHLLLPIFLFASLFSLNSLLAQDVSDEINAEKTAVVDNSQLEKTFRSYEVIAVEIDDQLVDLANNSGTELQIPFDGRDFIMDLAKNGLIADNYSLRTPSGLSRTTPAVPTDGYTQKGQRVAMTLNVNFLFGSWTDEHGEQIFIEPLRFHDKSAQDAQHIIYYSKDVLDTTTGSCGVTAKHHLHKGQANPNGSSKMQMNDCLEVEIALAADYLMFQKYGSVQDVEDRNIGVMNDVQTNYDDEFDTDLIYEIVEQFVSDCSSCDPWTSSTDPGTLLNSFTDWAPSGFNATHDVGQLWSDRNFNGGTIGLAWLSSICTNNRYNICEDFSNNANLIRVLSAHELGHNFSLTHDAGGSGFIMAPSVNNTNEWSNQSENQMNNYLPRPCLDDCQLAPVADFGIVNTDICEESNVYFYSLATGPVEDHE
ncbi:MAG: hypothetical protein GVX78_00675, partial [Bacteroidetes bacterium]|nr:hypothetical protein [Bacteroidota bacterium]